MANDILGRLIADKYRVEKLIAEHESGDLYGARHEVLDKPVTLKILSPAVSIDPRWVRKFVDEARRASAVSHPNVLNLTDFGTDARGISYAVFEETKGETLRDLMGSGLVLEEKRAVSIARQIAAGVAAAHSKQIVHGGLEPKVIYVSTDDVGNELVKVMGFGRDTLEVPRDADPRYLAPEQCTEFPRADARSDVYSLGVLMYEMLSGGVPYDGRTAAEVLDKQNSEPPPPLSAFRRDLHPEIEPIVLSAMAAVPDQRYPNMSSLLEDLDTLAGVMPAAATEAAASTAKRPFWQTAVLVLTGIGLLAFALIYLTSTKRTDPTTQLQADAGSLPVQPIGPATGAQEESLARLPAQTEADIMAAESMQQQAGMLPGGDGYNPWANGGAPPPGAPLNSTQNSAPMPQYVPPGGQYYTVDPNGGSQFMPQEGGVILVPVPANTNAAPKASPTPKGSAANANTQAAPAATPKPLATPAPTVKTPSAQPGRDRQPAPGKAPAKTPAPPEEN